MIYILLVIMILFIVIGIVITKKVLNPLSVFNAIWLLVILLYQLKLSYLQDDMSNQTIKTFIICILSFSIICFFGLAIKVKDKKEDNIIVGYKTIHNLFIFWIVMEVIETIYSKGLPILWKLIGSSKTYMNYGIPTIHGLMNSVSLVIILLSFYLYLYKKQNENIKDKKLIIIITSILVFDACLITRQVIISAIIELVVIYLNFQKKIQWKKIILLSLIIILLFGIMGNFRTGYNEFLNVSVMKYNDINKNFIGFYWVYMYLTMTVSNVNNAVFLGVNDFGIRAISQQYIPTVISNMLFKEKIRMPNYLVTDAFNVSGFFIDFYLGFGNFGVFLISAIYGILGAYLYKKNNKNKTEKNILYYSIYLQIILLSFFYNHLLYLPSGFQFIIIYLIFTNIYQNRKQNAL